MDIAALRFTWVPFAGLDAGTLYDVLRFRQDIFIVEQASAYPDLDGLDPDCQHLLVTAPDGSLAAYLRARGPRAGHPGFIGRIVVGAPWRGTGLGRRLVAAGLDFMAQHYSGVPLRIGAQQHLEKFYAGFGFVTVGAPYNDGGIPHVTMWLGGGPADFQG
ncbi:GNAT family N-acetyltransferase [Niveispirillum irakense]|uniref:GNAT family N-acetyltransferase n=1 Tax=Niveispirillum irakense TaxID=34011 RepID=UPI00041711D3|nr:GNAT family N-acetyltransferase [Niveispirillum irakense]